MTLPWATSSNNRQKPDSFACRPSDDGRGGSKGDRASGPVWDAKPSLQSCAINEAANPASVTPLRAQYHKCELVATHHRACRAVSAGLLDERHPGIVPLGPLMLKARSEATA